MKFLNRTFAAVASLFGAASVTRGAPPEFTDGSLITIEPAHVSFQPHSVWGVMRTDMKQKDSDTQICSPTLMRREGQIYALYMPKSDLPLAAQAHQFLKNQVLDDLKVEEVTATSKIPIVRVRATKRVPENNYSAVTVFHFLLNSRGRMTVVYYLGSPDLAEGFAAWFAESIKNEEG